jgi:hypothetical protein
MRARTYLNGVLGAYGGPRTRVDARYGKRSSAAYVMSQPMISQANEIS